MRTIFKYRPLSEFLFKELYYQELYFASYSELNDPFDLSARIEFSYSKPEQVGYLFYFLFRTTFVWEFEKTDKIENFKKLINFKRDHLKVKEFNNEIKKRIDDLSLKNQKIWQDDILRIVNAVCQKLKLNFVFDLDRFNSELKRLTYKFLENSYVTCFSETNKNFQMWSHYASKHSGICLEFELTQSNFFPYIMQGERDWDLKKYQEGYSDWDIKAYTYSDLINKVSYVAEQPHINFFEFSSVFENENDCDLIRLSKSWTHFYADKLCSVFSTKTAQWSYEQEWRAIHINFAEPLEPEDRIRHYPVESLKSIFFGMRTPDIVKKRICSIFRSLKNKVEFFECIPTNGNGIEFTGWQCDQ